MWGKHSSINMGWIQTLEQYYMYYKNIGGMGSSSISNVVKKGTFLPTWQLCWYPGSMSRDDDDHLLNWLYGACPQLRLARRGFWILQSPLYTRRPILAAVVHSNQNNFSFYKFIYSINTREVITSCLSILHAVIKGSTNILLAKIVNNIISSIIKKIKVLITFI